MNNLRSYLRRGAALTLFAALFFTVGAFAQNGGRPALAGQDSQVTEFEVNGLKVIVKKRPNAPTLSVGLFVRGGVQNLTPSTAGLENLTLSVATEASKKYPRDVMRSELSRMASSIGAGSNSDFSVVSLTSTQWNFDKSWDIFTDTVMNPSFTPKDFELVRDRMLTGLKNQSLSPDNALDVLRDKVVYAGHPYAAEPNGSAETISTFTVDALRAYHKKIMTTSQLLLVVVGDIDAEQLKPRVAATLGKLPRGSYVAKTLPELNFEKPSVDITSRPLETNYVKGVFAAPSLSSPDYYAMRVAMTILQSRVIDEVRSKRQLSYAPDASMDDNRANTASIYVTANDANQSVFIMLKLIEDMRNNGIEEDALTGLPGYFLTTYFLKLETNAAQVAELAKFELIGGGWRNSLGFIDKIREVKGSDVKRVAAKYMKNIRFVVIGDPKAVNKKIFLDE